MTPSTETWLISTISKRLERIAEGKEPMAEDRALTLLSILKDVAGDIPSLTNLPQHVKEWLEAAINARLDAIAEKREIAAEDRIATLTEALAALRPPASPGGSVERVDTGVGLSGGPITTTGTISLSTSSQQAIARANTSVQPEDLADVATSGNYADLTNTPDIPEQFNPIQGANMLITGTYPNITFSAVAGEEFTPVWGEIQGTLADQTDLQDALDGKAPTVHTHTWGQLTDLPAFATRWPTWGEVTGKPSTFAPSSHTHTIANITNLQSTLNAKANASDFTYVGQKSGGSYDSHIGSGNNFAYLWHSAGGQSTDAPFSPARQAAVLHMGNTWGRVQVAISSESVPQVYVRGAEESSWTTVWTSGNFDPNSKANSSHTHAASDITSGTLAADRIPNLAASKVTSGTFNANRIPNLNASKITAGTFAAARIPDLSSSYVATSGNQSNLSGNKTWTGNHTFTSSSNTDSLTVERTGSTARNAYVTYSTDATTIYAGIANVNDTTWGIGTNPNLTPNNVQFQFDTSTGNMSASGNVTATNLTATSDPRLKKDIKRVKARRELIEKLEYFSFKWKKDGVAGRSVMADKVQEIAPEHVHVGDDEMGTLSVDKGALALEMVFALIDVLKEQEFLEGG